MSTEQGSKIFEDVFQNIRKAAEANLKLQQEAFQQWTNLWPGEAISQPAWVEQIRDFQKKWGDSVADLARKHRDVLDKQYQAALESLEAALKVNESTNAEEFRRRSEQLCRKSLDCMKEMSEAQMREFQQTVSKWTELVSTVGA